MLLFLEPGWWWYNTHTICAIDFCAHYSQLQACLPFTLHLCINAQSVGLSRPMESWKAFKEYMAAQSCFQSNVSITFKVTRSNESSHFSHLSGLMSSWLWTSRCLFTDDIQFHTLLCESHIFCLSSETLSKTLPSCCSCQSCHFESTFLWNEALRVWDEAMCIRVRDGLRE